MIPRPNELKKIESEYNKSGNSLALIYGNYGCEKEAFIKSFINGKNSIYYCARECSKEKQLLFFKEQLVKDFDLKAKEDSYQEFFNRVKPGSIEKLVLVIDNADFIVRQDSSFMDAVNLLIARKLYPGPVMVVLMASSIVWASNQLEDKVFASKLDLSLKLENHTFLDIVRYFNEYSVANCVSTYGIIGGNASYINRWNGKKSIKENIINNILRPTGYLYREADNILSSELRELSSYKTILGSIAAGNEKLNDLFADTGYSRAKISVYLKNLAEFDIVKKSISFETGGWDNAKKGVYTILNPFIDFYFTFIYPNLSDFYMQKPEEFYEKHIMNSLDQYLQKYFAIVCREYLMLVSLSGQLPFKLHKLGTWIGKEGTIDVVGQSSHRENIVGICNWNQKVMSIEEYEKLLLNMKLAKLSAAKIFLFSATSFDQRLIQLSKADDTIILVDMKEL